MNLARNVSVLGVVAAALLAGVGCSAAQDDSAGADDSVTGAATPAQNSLVFEQVKTCDNLFKDRAAFRDVDLQEGVLRWKCGDVDGVTMSKCEDDLALLAAEEAKGGNVSQQRTNLLGQCGNGYGQEYCEYNAVANGGVVNGIKAGATLTDKDVVQCVFTSVQSDFKGTLASPAAFADDLSSKVEPQLIAASRVPEGRVSGMKQGVNSRGAADTLINDCATLAKGGDQTYAKDADRQVLCYNAWSAATTPADKAKFETACKGVDLSNDSAWGKTGLTQTDLTDADHDLASCTMVLKAKHGGVSWRNSDPTICARSYRAAHECNVDFKQIGTVAPTFPGFSMQGWTNRATLPTGCKYASLDAANPYVNVVICTAGAQDVKNYRTQKKSLQTLCRDKFGVNVAMQAPIGALANLAAAKEDSPFCKAFVAGARHAQAPAPAAAPPAAPGNQP